MSPLYVGLFLDNSFNQHTYCQRRHFVCAGSSTSLYRSELIAAASNCNNSTGYEPGFAEHLSAT
jgi:hypothetical protein